MVDGSSLFEELFVLDLANNHWGKLERGLKIIEDYSRVVRFNGVKAAIKLQIRDVDNFIHKDFRDRTDIRYIKKTLDTRMGNADYAVMVDAIRKAGCVPMATPFDEASVDFCLKLDLDIIKIASSDLNDWFLIEKIAKARKPVIVSTGGSNLKDIDDLVKFFNRRNIPLAVNHCVSIYPSEDAELEINQVDFLRDRYPDNVIGFSSHEYHDWEHSIMIAYAKGARTFERHIDIDDGAHPLSKYNSLPHQVDTWFKAFRKAQELCGPPGTQKRIPPAKETAYLASLIRGVYARHDLRAGHRLVPDDVYLAIPWQEGQMSCRELMSGEKLTADIARDAPVRVADIESPYSAAAAGRGPGTAGGAA